MYQSPLDRVESRGLGFSELQSYFSLPFSDFAVVGDVTVCRDKHRRPLYDTIHVCTTNPIQLYSMKPTGEEINRMPINHLFDTKSQNTIPRYLDYLAERDEFTEEIVSGVSGNFKDLF